MLRTLSISSTIFLNERLVTIRDDDNSSSIAAVPETDEDNDDDVRNVLCLCRSNATRRDKSTVRTDNRMALAGCWNVYFAYLLLSLEAADAVIAILFLRDLCAEVMEEAADNGTADNVFGGATCRMVIAANVGGAEREELLAESRRFFTFECVRDFWEEVYW